MYLAPLVLTGCVILVSGIPLDSTKKQFYQWDNTLDVGGLFEDKVYKQYYYPIEDKFLERPRRFANMYVPTFVPNGHTISNTKTKQPKSLNVILKAAILERPRRFVNMYVPTFIANRPFTTRPKTETKKDPKSSSVIAKREILERQRRFVNMYVPTFAVNRQFPTKPKTEAKQDPKNLNVITKRDILERSRRFVNMYVPRFVANKSFTTTKKSQTKKLPTNIISKRDVTLLERKIRYIPTSNKSLGVGARRETETKTQAKSSIVFRNSIDISDFRYLRHKNILEPILLRKY